MYSNFIVVIFVLAIMLMTFQQLTPGYLIGVILLILVFTYMVKYSPKLYEHLQVSSEAIQNVGSIYNKDKMIIKDLEVTPCINSKIIIIIENYFPIITITRILYLI